MIDDLPRGWLETELPSVAELNMGQSPPSNTYNIEGRGLPFFQGKTEFGKIYPSPVKYCSDPTKIAEAGDVLISVRAPVGPTNLCRERSCIGRGLAAIRPIGDIPSRYLLYFLRNIEPWLSRQGTGSTFTAISKSDLEQLSLPVCPLAEQRRIVEKLEKLLGQLDSCQRRLAKIPALLKRFRQSVLTAACSGRLTADWRQENPDVEPAANLVLEPQFQMAESENELPDLPESWAWVALGNYGRCSRGRFSVRPRNDPSYFGGRHPFIQIGNLPPEGGWIKTHTQTLNEKGLAVSKQFSKGTVVIAIVGATIGNTGLLAYDMCFTDSLVGIETDSEEGNRFVEFFLRSKKLEIRQASYSSGGQPNIKLDFLNPYPLALPPLPEQKEIVRRVENLFALADRIEARFVEGRKRVDSITQAILAKAFRGELVPTEAELAEAEGRSFESTEDLLARISDAHMNGGSSKQRKQRSA